METLQRRTPKDMNRSYALTLITMALLVVGIVFLAMLPLFGLPFMGWGLFIYCVVMLLARVVFELLMIFSFI